MRNAYIKMHHIIFEALGVLCAVISLIYMAIKVASLEGPVPTHFGFDGKPDGYGEPATLLLVPVIMLVVILTMALISSLSSPRKWNLPVRPKEGREALVYSDMTLMLAILCGISGLYTLLLSISLLSSSEPSILISALYFLAILVDVVVCSVMAVAHNK